MNHLFHAFMYVDANPILRDPSSRLNYFLKPPAPNTIHLRLKDSTYEPGKWREDWYVGM